MGKKAIWSIIILMSTALIGIIIIQLYWIRSSVEREEDAFNNKVYLIMGKVQEKLQSKSEGPMEAFNFFKQSNRIETNTPGTSDMERLFSDYPEYRKQKVLFEIKSLERSINPSILLDGIIPKELDDLIADAMKEQKIDAKYDYGVFSTEIEDFIIVNGVFSAAIGETENKSTIVTSKNKSLYAAPYEIQLFASEFNIPGYLKISFPNKISWLWANVLPSLISSIIFTGLILFCFSYTIYIILRQKQVSEMKTDFINNMTHEFKTPIATISLAADSIINPNILNNPDKVMRFSKIIKEENKRMLNQVEKVLQMAVLDKKDFSLNINTLDLHALINTAVNHGNLQVQAKNGNISVELNANDANFEGDETHISNIIHNLLDNAIKYTPVDPNITISTVNKNNGIEMTISDNGIGMTKEARKQIFDKFYRVHTGNLHDVKGFGLGLSYVKAIVIAHKGNIEVESELGVGSKFMIHFPAKIM